MPNPIIKISFYIELFVLIEAFWLDELSRDLNNQSVGLHFSVELL